MEKVNPASVSRCTRAYLHLEQILGTDIAQSSLYIVLTALKDHAVARSSILEEMRRIHAEDVADEQVQRNRRNKGADPTQTA